MYITHVLLTPLLFHRSPIEVQRCKILIGNPDAIPVSPGVLPGDMSGRSFHIETSTSQKTIDITKQPFFDTAGYTEQSTHIVGDTSNRISGPYVQPLTLPPKTTVPAAFYLSALHGALSEEEQPNFFGKSYMVLGVKHLVFVEGNYRYAVKPGTVVPNQGRLGKVQFNMNTYFTKLSDAEREGLPRDLGEMIAGILETVIAAAKAGDSPDFYREELDETDPLYEDHEDEDLACITDIPVLTYAPQPLPPLKKNNQKSSGLKMILDDIDRQAAEPVPSRKRSSSEAADSASKHRKTKSKGKGKAKVNPGVAFEEEDPFADSTFEDVVIDSGCSTSLPVTLPMLPPTP